jgi:hypothetical protein
MITRDPQYTRLTRGSRSFLRQTSLWLGPEHLLAVHIEFFTERYQRFAYRDVQAIVIRRTWHYLAQNIVLTALIVPLVLTGIFAELPAMRIAVGIAGACLALILIINLLRGPTCRCFLHTAVNTEKLQGLQRVRKARRVIATLKTRIDQIQST